MTAEEALQLSTKARQISCQNVYNTIRKAAEAGEISTRYDLKGNEAKFADTIINDLQKNYFKVKRELGSCPREGDSWDYLWIQWS